MQAFGFTAPIIVGSDDEILAGHARLQAAKGAGLIEVPTISLAHLKREEQRAFMLGDNVLAGLSTWEDDLLKIELLDLGNFDLGLTLADLGFDTPEMNRILLTEGNGKIAIEDDEAPPEVAAVAVTAVGDVWVMGHHRLICGDARMAEVYAHLMPEGEVARVIVADPPYNVPVKGHVTKRNADRREFAMGVGAMSIVEFTAFLTTTLSRAASRATDGAIAYVLMDWRHMTEALEAGQQAVGELKNLVVWAKPNAGMGAFYRSQHELVFVFKKGRAQHVNNLARVNMAATAPTSGPILERRDSTPTGMATSRCTSHLNPWP